MKCQSSLYADGSTWAATSTGVFAFRAEHPAVDAGEAHGRDTACDESGDDASVGQPAENGECEVARFGVAHAKASHESRFHSHPFRPFADERAAAVDDDEWMPCVVERDDRVERRVVLGADRSADLQHEQVLTWCSRH